MLLSVQTNLIDFWRGGSANLPPPVRARKSSALPNFTPWVLLAGTSTGSTWINHVLESHPCITTQNEIILKNKTAGLLWQSGAAGIEQVLRDVIALNVAELEQRDRQWRGSLSAHERNNTARCGTPV